MKNNQESKSFWEGQGLLSGVDARHRGAATASFLAINSMMDKLGADPAPQIQGEEDIPWQEEQHTPVEEKQEDVPVAPHIAILVIEAAKYGFICAQLIACFIRARRACKLAAGANALVRIAAGWGGLAGFQW